MRHSYRPIFFFIMILSLTLPVQAQDDLQKRIQDIDVLLDDTLSSWKINEKDVPGGEKVSRDDSEWPAVRTGTTIRDKVFWLRQQFQAPENFAGVRTQGTEITLSCIFRGLGVMEGHFFQDGELKDSFILEFGNQSNQIKKEFVITTDAAPEEESLLAFRFKNLGRLPLINKKVTEPGTYFQLQEARFRIQKSQDAHEMLDRLKGYQDQNIFPKIKHTTAARFLEQIKKRKPDLPVWKDELYLEYHRGTYTTQAETKKLMDT